jgi:3-deoxy-D-manno-octulosonic-acid transferase
MVLSLYRAATTLAGPLVPLILRRRQRLGKEDPARRGERLGIASQPRPSGPLIWVHAASVGESLAALPLIDRLLAEDAERHVLVTTHTLTSAAIMAERLPPRGIHQVSPFDRPAYVTRFLDHWQPQAALWLESELWPNMLAGLTRRHVPAALLNARLSPRSLARWQRFPGLWRRLTGGFALIQPSSNQARQALADLGAQTLAAAGNLKYSAAAPPVDATKAAQIETAIAGRPVWAAASTHPGEEQIILAAHRAVRASLPDALLILIPRHPNRGAELARLVEEGDDGPVPRRSQGTLPGGQSPVYLADTMGEMGTLLSQALVSFVGGSLVPIGGHNPLEPARLASAILAGPHVDNFADMYADLASAGAYRPVTADDVADTVTSLLNDGTARRDMTEAAGRIAERQSALLDQIMAGLAPLLPAPRARAAE